MKKTICLSLLIFLYFSSLGLAQNRGDLISSTLVASYDLAGIEDVYEDFGLTGILAAFFAIDYDSVEIHKLVYWTIDARGEALIEASGLVTIPVSTDCAFPVVNYNHGTLRYDAQLSDLNAFAMQHLVGVPFAANGYVMVSPDFLGYGATPNYHPHAYLHAKSEATAVVDMLRAATVFCETAAIPLSEQLFLSGYSHGGHVTMAAHRELQEFHAEEFRVVASAPISGAYDLSGTMRDSILLSDNFSNSFFIGFSMLSYQFVYGNLYEDLSEVFVSPYDSLIPLMLNREDPQSDIFDLLPTAGYQMFQPAYRDAVLNDPEHPVNVAIRDNDVYDWIPQAPTHLYYCESDDVVPFSIALSTSDHMISLGAEDVTAINVSEEEDHQGCAIPSVLFAKVWFDEFRESCNTSASTLAFGEAIRIYPNPFTDGIYLDTREILSGSQLDVQVFDYFGRLVSQLPIRSGENQFISLQNLPAAIYLVRISGEKGGITRMIVKGR